MSRQPLRIVRFNHNELPVSLHQEVVVEMLRSGFMVEVDGKVNVYRSTYERSDPRALFRLHNDPFPGPDPVVIHPDV